ncbi:MAG: hypothetical protein OXF79_22720 [Chloroflexi bacterium]|nr:hypothetical protein [Chloroflexota bacterium]
MLCDTHIATVKSKVRHYRFLGILNIMKQLGEAGENYEWGDGFIKFPGRPTPVTTFQYTSSSVGNLCGGEVSGAGRPVPE